MKNKILDSVLKKCQNCGGNLIFDPNSQKLLCEKCESYTDFQKNQNILVHDLSQSAKFAGNNNDSSTQCFKCKSCGANVILSKYEISKECPYCETTLVIDKNAMTGHKPDGIIPFMFDKHIANQNFAKNVKKKWLAPNAFKKQLPPNKIKGIYIPSFGFNVKTSSTYSGTLYKDETRGSGDDRRTVRRYFDISGQKSVDFANIQVESSSKMTQHELSGILPYNYNYTQTYNDAFIRGYSVERYDTAVENCKIVYKNIVDNKIRNNILSGYNYSGVSRLDVKTWYNDETYSYFLLPVYKFEYTYKNKPFITYMNGQTGQIDSNIPKSPAKITFVVVLLLLIFALPFILGIIAH